MQPIAGVPEQPSRRDGHLFMVGIAVVTGLFGAFGAVVFRLMIRSVQAFAFEGADGLASVAEEGLLAEAGDPLAVASTLEWYWRLLIPAVGGLIVGPLIYFFAREARGHGVPEVIKAVALRGGVIRARVVAIKSLASAISIGTGGSVGREGPIVQIGSALGSAFGQLLNVPARQLRTIVGCGAAAGISATFNAPIAGALFAAEVIVGDFAVAQFSPIVISSVVATVASRFFLGNHPAFPVPAYEIVSPFELAPYMVAGVLAGLVGVAFIYTLNLSETLFERLRFPEYLKASLGGLAVGLIGIELPQVFGVGYTTISAALAGSLTVATLGVLLVAKILATSVTIGSGGSGGIFAPSLFLGAMTGGFLGTFIHQWFPDATAASGAYALVTMGAVVAATTHAPISAILIIFELTQTIEIIPALMAACVLSTLVSQLLSRDSIYTSKLRRQGVDIFRRPDPNPLKDLHVRDAIDRDPEVIPASANFQTLLDLVVQSPHTQFFVVGEDGQLLGAIALAEVRRLIYERETLGHLVVASDLLDTSRPTVSEDDDLDLVVHLYASTGVEELAVVDPVDPTRLVGTVRQGDVIEARNQEMLRRDLTGGMSSSVSAVQHGQQVDLGGGFALREVVAPPSTFDRSLRELNLSARTGVHVLLIRRHSPLAATEVRVPSSTDIIREGDTLVVAGERA
ncbi:MAG: chloride channel protein, partial [Proteobacteria bacterium]|nr:chloride channel protein [Pseudomonadota bacterium]